MDINNINIFDYVIIFVTFIMEFNKIVLNYRFINLLAKNY
jgi:hypothetical protein